MRVAIVVVSLILGVGLSWSAVACTCIPLGDDFFETVHLHNEKIRSGEWSDELVLTVVTAKVKEHKQVEEPFPTEMVLEVTGVIQGEVEQKSLTVEGDNGALCRPYVMSFPVGKHFIFALNQEGGTHYISICGQYAKEISVP